MYSIYMRCNVACREVGLCIKRQQQVSQNVQCKKRLCECVCVCVWGGECSDHQQVTLL